MYPDVVAAAGHIDVDHGCTGDVEDQARRRPRRSRTSTREPFRIGYARTLQQQADLAAAVAQLQSLQVHSERIFTDRGDDALIGHRPQLEAALSAARRGDTLVVADLARLARSHPELLTLHTRLTGAGIRLEVDGTDFDQLDPRRLLELTAAMHTRHATEAIEEDYRHRTQRHPQGPRRRLNPHERLQIRELADAGIPRDELAELFGISRATVYRAIGARTFTTLRMGSPGHAVDDMLPGPGSAMS